MPPGDIPFAFYNNNNNNNNNNNIFRSCNSENYQNKKIRSKQETVDKLVS